MEESQKQSGRSIGVREITEDDFDQIIEMQLKSFPGMKPWDRDQLTSQIEKFPEGQLCIELEGKVVASSCSLIVDSNDYDHDHSWKEVTSSGYITNHDPDGDTLYGIEIMVHPEHRGLRLARRLYQARKDLARKLNLHRIVIGGRIPGYAEHKDEMSAREYVEEVMGGRFFDPVLTVQLNNGFHLKRVIEDYLAVDRESHGYATLLEWTNIDYIPEPNRRYHSSRNVRICSVQYQMRRIKDFKEFAEQCEYFVDVASGYRSDFALFPELLTTQLMSAMPNMPPNESARAVAGYTDDYLELFTGLAIKYNVNLIGGSHFVIEDDRVHNVSFLFNRDGRINKQYKIHITPNERRWWGVEPGDSIEVFDTDCGKIAIQICYDVEFPEMTRIAVHKGAQIVFVPFCTDERKGYLRVRYCAQARCIENGIYVATAGTVGNMPQVENMDVQYAQSGIFTPSDFGFARDGIAAECTPNIETVVIHDVDINALRRHRRRGTTLNWNDRRTDLYRIEERDES